MNTVATTRIPFGDPERLSIAISQLLFPSGGKQLPNAVLLATGNDFRTVVPAVSLIHFPIHAMVLFSWHGDLSNQLMREINRIQPTGKNAPAAVLLVGPFTAAAIGQLHRAGYSTLHFEQNDPYVQMVHIADWRRRYLPDTMPEMITGNTFLISSETVEESLPVFGFAAHMGTPILYAQRDSLPDLTRRFLQREKHRHVTIIGSESIISRRVEEECRSVVNGTVERFSGSTPQEMAILFARAKSKATQIGFGRHTPGKGDAFTFLPTDWRMAMAAAAMSHTGKHTPLLPLSKTDLPNLYRRYLESLLPQAGGPQPPFMHAFVLGDMQQIPFSTQVEIEGHIQLADPKIGATGGPE
ncbi:cell wall-binding repeat-containing protein [Effusibacillus dendaii]|uniref:Uncharacterized protein n=1 Tax=Effusibacillus dendaii TaxID=2743772 RepID=A0A7I8DF42_9BACL|nr:hypothetical protein [Effusibacillus dendaii]BCJ87912.1 hypothetical protein skT53_28970 [Effusibacillus dendaii]